GLPAAPAGAMRVNAQDSRSVPSNRVPRRVQPDGVDIVASRFVVPISTSASPACTAAGVVTEACETLALEDAAARKATALAPPTVTEWLAESVSPPGSVTVSVTG